jgi:uncharacterized membrane-anchored protein
MKNIFLPFLLCFFYTASFAQEVDSTQLFLDAIEQSLNYETGTIELESRNATLTVPEGFRYLNRKQSMYVLSDLWGNPADTSVLGLLVPENKGVLADDSWVFVLSFDELGFVEDDDAEDIDYDDLLADEQKETQEESKQRVQMGYEAIELVGWASKPYYDKEKKVLHWAKELKFADAETNTLNYNLRVLGRKGVFVINAVASMNELPEVKSSISHVISSVEYKEGHRYADFTPGVDQVAAWTIGGLVAGKILAKAGFFALLLKFWKLIAVAVIGFGGAIWRRISGKPKDDEQQLAEAEDAPEIPTGPES